MSKRQLDISVFLELLRAGLWEREVRLFPFKAIDFEEVFRLAQEQSVVGLVAAGLEHVTHAKVPSKDVLPFVGQTMQIEQRNMAMNRFIAEVVLKMGEAGIYTLLEKGVISKHSLYFFS